MSAKHQLHPSGMESLARCGVAYERRYIQGEKTLPGARAVVGTAVDKSVRYNLQVRIDCDIPGVALEDAKAMARDTLVSEWEKGVRLTEEDKEDAISGRDKAIDMSVNLAGFHHQKVAPMIHPTHVARKWVLDIEGLNLQVAGEIDIQEGLTAIRDTKTSGKSPVKTMADESLQLSTYALAVRQIDGALPDKVVLDYLVQTPKRGDLKLVQLESVRTDKQLQPVLERLAHMDKIIQSGIFTPAPIGAWWCSARYCAYHETCRFAARPVSVHVSSPAIGAGYGAGAQSVPDQCPPTAKLSPPHDMGSARENAASVNGKSGGVSAISPPDDLEDRLRQSLEMANGTRKLHLVTINAR